MDNKPQLGATESVYYNAGGDDPLQKPVDYFDQKVQNHTINQLQKKQSRKKIQNFLLRACVFIVFICSPDDITTCSALVKQYGPTVFLPILICSLCIGMPLIYLEMGLGQFTSSNPIAIFSNMAPIGAGIGYTMVIISVLDVFRQIHLSTVFAHILIKSMMGITGGDFYMTRCIFPYQAGESSYLNPNLKSALNCIDPHIRCAGIGSSYYARQELQTTTKTAQFHLTYKEENSQCVSNMQVMYAKQHLTAARLSQSSAIERYLDLFLTNVGHDPSGREVPTAAMDYNITGLIVIALLMTMMYYDTTFIEGAGVVGTIFLLLNFAGYAQFVKQNSSGEYAYNNFVMPPELIYDAKMWIDVLNYVLMAIQVGQAGHITLASSNNFSNNFFRDAILIALIVTITPYGLACLLTSNWEKFVISQMSDMKDRKKYWASGHLKTGLKNTKPTAHITSSYIYEKEQMAAIYVIMVYFLSSTFTRMLISFRSIVRTFQEQFSAQLAIDWTKVCKMFACLYLVMFMVANTSWMRLALDSIRVGSVRAMPIIVLCYLCVVMFCYGIRRTFLDLNTMLFLNDRKIERAAMLAGANKNQKESRGAMKQFSSAINIFTGIAWFLTLGISCVLAYFAWFKDIRAGDLYNDEDAKNEIVMGRIMFFSAVILSPMILVGAWRFVNYLHESFNGNLAISFLFSPSGSYGPKDERHRIIVANETNSVRM